MSDVIEFNEILISASTFRLLPISHGVRVKKANDVLVVLQK